MNLRALLAVCLLGATLAHGGEVQIQDRIIQRDKGPIECTITSETADEIKARTGGINGPERPAIKRREVRSVLYAFQRQSSAWTQGMDARERGKYPESADLFAALATGAREAEKVVGSYEEGISWELAGDFAKAAAAFGKVAAGFKAHPLALDARYRLGMVLARAGTPDKAEVIAKELDADGKSSLGQAAVVRASAVRASIALAQNNLPELKRQVGRAAFNPDTERPAWLHFNLFVADSLRATGNGKEASAIYQAMLPQLAADPAAASRVRLGIGVSKAQSDRPGAILDLLALDALPYGSPEQKCEARFLLGKLLLEEAAALENDKANEARMASARENRQTARLMLQAAAESTAAHPSREQADALLKSLSAAEAPAAK